MNKHLTVLVGSPGSGKSTYAYQLLLLSDKPRVRINQDDQGRAGHWIKFQEALKHKAPHIIIDRMGFNKQQREKYLIPAKQAGYSTSIVIFDVPKEVCLQRCLERKHHPTVKTEENAIRAVNFFFEKYEAPTEDEADEITVKTMNILV